MLGLTGPCLSERAGRAREGSNEGGHESARCLSDLNENPVALRKPVQKIPGTHRDQRGARKSWRESRLPREGERRARRREISQSFLAGLDGISDESGAGRTEPNAMSLAGCRPSVRAGAASSMKSWRRERKGEDWLGCEGGEDGGEARPGGRAPMADTWTRRRVAIYREPACTRRRELL